MMAKAEKDPRCVGGLAKLSKYGDPHVSLRTNVFCLPISSRSNFSEQPLGNVSAITDVFLKGSSAQMNSFAFHELRFNSFLFAPPHARHITQFGLPSCYISYCRLLTECWRRWRRTHVPRPSSRTTFCFSLMVFLPCATEQHGVESRLPLAAIYLCGFSWLQTSFGARGRTCRQYCHFF